MAVDVMDWFYLAQTRYTWRVLLNALTFGFHKAR